MISVSGKIGDHNCPHINMCSIFSRINILSNHKARCVGYHIMGTYAHFNAHRWCIHLCSHIL